MKLVSSKPPEPKDREAELLALFEKNSYRELRSSLDGGKGRPLRLALDIIDEDEKQPRKAFDAEELESLAASIRLKGVIQPIGVFPAVNGRHLLAFGARRLRASRLAGCTDIPAIIREPEPGNSLAQLIENQQRSNLSNSELATAIGELSAEGYTVQQLATICNISPNYISAFRRVCEFPPSLVARLNNADIRALSELYSQWKKTPDTIDTTLHLIPDTYINVAEARRIIERLNNDIQRPPAHSQTPSSAVLSGLSTSDAPRERPPGSGRSPATDFSSATTGQPGSSCSDTTTRFIEPSHAPNGQPAPTPAPAANDPVITSPPASPPPATPTGQGSPAPRTNQHTPKPTRKSKAPIFIIRQQDREGHLIVNRRSHELHHALIDFSTGVESIPLNQIELVRID